MNRRGLGVGILVLLTVPVASSGCAYLKWRKDRNQGLAELKKPPNLVLEREVLPEDCFVLAGGPDYPDGVRPQVLAVDGELGVYQPTRFMARLENVLFPVGEPDPKKIQVVLVHGIDGTPRDFATGPSPAGDGTIALASQLDPRAQAVATNMSGYGQTHVGILSDKAALEELSRLLDETCSAKAERTDSP